MSQPPDKPKIYHITHVENLPSIVADGGLLCDRAVLRRGGTARMIGMATIKRRRCEEIEVSCHPGTKVGDYVPFYFCSRSIMLYVIHCANHPELTYRGGQGPILHLEADLHEVTEWAEREDRPWAFSLSNAGAYYARFRTGRASLGELHWPSIVAKDFRDPDVKEHKQAEFLVHEGFPFHLVRRIGAHSQVVRDRALAALAEGEWRPPVVVLPAWYY
jgi:hypothetical protein